MFTRITFDMLLLILIPSFSVAKMNLVKIDNKYHLLTMAENPGDYVALTNIVTNYGDKNQFGTKSDTQNQIDKNKFLVNGYLVEVENTPIDKSAGYNRMQGESQNDKKYFNSYHHPNKREKYELAGKKKYDILKRDKSEEIIGQKSTASFGREYRKRNKDIYVLEVESSEEEKSSAQFSNTKEYTSPYSKDEQIHDEQSAGSSQTARLRQDKAKYVLEFEESAEEVPSEKSDSRSITDSSSTHSDLWDPENPTGDSKESDSGDPVIDTKNLPGDSLTSSESKANGPESSISDPETNPNIDPESRSSSDPESRPRSDPERKLNSDPESRPGNGPESRSSGDSENRPSSDLESRQKGSESKPSDSAGSDSDPDSSDSDSDGIISDPDSSLNFSNGSYSDPDSSVSGSDGSASDSDRSVSESDISISVPNSSASESDGSVYDPDSSFSDPDGNASDPDGNISDSDGSASDPDSSVNDSDGSASDPDSSVSNSQGSASDPGTSISGHDPKDSASNPKSSRGNSESIVSNPKDSANDSESSPSYADKERGVGGTNFDKENRDGTPTISESGTQRESGPESRGRSEYKDGSGSGSGPKSNPSSGSKSRSEPEFRSGLGTESGSKSGSESKSGSDEDRFESRSGSGLGNGDKNREESVSSNSISIAPFKKTFKKRILDTRADKLPRKITVYNKNENGSGSNKKGSVSSNSISIPPFQMKNFDSRADKLPREIKVSDNREEKHENHRDSNELELVKDEGQDYAHDYGQNYVHDIGIIPFKIRKK